MLLSRKIVLERLALRTPVIMNTVGAILANVDFAVRVCDFVNDVHQSQALANSASKTASSFRRRYSAVISTTCSKLHGSNSTPAATAGVVLLAAARFGATTQW